MRLTAKARGKLPAKAFGEPAARKFPVNNKSHAVAAKGRATQAVNAGRMSKSTEAKIDAKANRVLGKGKRPKVAGHEFLAGSKHWNAT